MPDAVTFGAQNLSLMASLRRTAAERGGGGASASAAAATARSSSALPPPPAQRARGRVAALRFAYPEGSLRGKLSSS